jgi:Ser/Thr protein kinase RdoA (MazF antagonist)
VSDTPAVLSAFHDLGPDAILDAVEAAGFPCDGRISALNSYENRVYQVGITDATPLVAKFYRPERWSDAAILEEHAFTLELAAREIPVAAPVADAGGRTLFHAGPHRLALYPRLGGRPPEADSPDQLEMLGRCIARIHNVGAAGRFAHRPLLDIESFAREPGVFVLENDFVPGDLRAAYEALLRQVLLQLEEVFERAGPVRRIRLHGDFHLGNLLVRDDAPLVMDFDDARTGPAVQDLWMLLSGDRAYMTARLYDVLDGYCEFREFDARELHLVEALRTMRIMHFAGWIALRWDDPAFPRAFPAFNSQRFWEEHILALKEQLAMMDEPPLEWRP